MATTTRWLVATTTRWLVGVLNTRWRLVLWWWLYRRRLLLGRLATVQGGQGFLIKGGGFFHWRFLFGWRFLLATIQGGKGFIKGGAFLHCRRLMRRLMGRLMRRAMIGKSGCGERHHKQEKQNVVSCWQRKALLIPLWKIHHKARV